MMYRQGLAKTVFAETFLRTPWLSSRADTFSQQNQSAWPMLDRLFAEQRLSYLDYVLTHRLLRNHPNTDQNVALFLCHLILAANAGHVCVKINKDELKPSAHQLWHNEEGRPLNNHEAQILNQCIYEGAKEVPQELVTTVSNTSTIYPASSFCRYEDNFYLQRHWVFETSFLKAFDKHLKTSPALTFDQEKITASVNQLVEQKILLKEQAQAIIQAAKNTITLVTGGPGTGKTYTAGHLIKVFWQQLPPDKRKSCQIVLAAPTGKAAANLQRSLSKVATTLEDFPAIQAKTLHALLGMKQNTSEYVQARLTADLILIDETSMIDLRMMAYLFEALKPGSRIILLGDQHQLPSVEAGSVFKDLIHSQETCPKLSIPCIHLKVCLRAEIESLVDFASLVNRGDGKEILKKLNNPIEKGIKRLQLAEGVKESQQQLIAQALQHFPTVVKEGERPEDLLELFNAMRLLSPVKKGPFGVEVLNHLMWQKVCKTLPTNGWMAIPIMILTNDYRQELFNGETGLLMRKHPLQSVGVEDYALFPSKDGVEGARRLPAILLPKYDHAYCLSVHKSQGSEFDRVILVLPEGAELFGREVFYTAVTRARHEITICGLDEVILKTVEQKGMRLSGIEERLSVVAKGI